MRHYASQLHGIWPCIQRSMWINVTSKHNVIIGHYETRQRIVAFSHQETESMSKNCSNVVLRLRISARKSLRVVHPALNTINCLIIRRLRDEHL